MDKSNGYCGKACKAANVIFVILLSAAAGIGAACALRAYMSCKIPTESDAFKVQIGCLESLDNKQLRHKACSQIGQDDSCDLHSAARREMVESLIADEADKCYKETAKKAGFCPSN